MNRICDPLVEHDMCQTQQKHKGLVLPLPDRLHGNYPTNNRFVLQKFRIDTYVTHAYNGNF